MLTFDNRSWAATTGSLYVIKNLFRGSFAIPISKSKSAVNLLSHNSTTRKLFWLRSRRSVDSRTGINWKEKHYIPQNYSNTGRELIYMKITYVIKKKRGL
jgi:hypothetical protein